MYATQQLLERDTHDPVIFSEISVEHSFVPYHWHRACEIIFITSGELCVTVRQQEYHLGAGDGIVINSGEIHSTVSVSGNSSLLMQIPDVFWEYYVPGRALPVLLSFSQCDERCALRIRLKALIKARKESGGNYLAYYSALFSFMEELYRCQAPGSAARLMPLNRKQEERLKVIEAFVKAHYREAVSLEDIAATVYLQPNYFCRFFKGATGMSFLDYLNEYRFLKVYEDLTTTEDAVKDILLRHGFYNEQLFRRMFMEKYHCTPVQWRAKLKALGQKPVG